MNDIISRILNDSITAPSPDNFQPWRFEVAENEISVFKVPGKVNHLLDCNDHVLILTNGMLIENIVIAASNYGYRPDLTFFPDKSISDLVAKVHLTREPNIISDPLYHFLKTRCTNRKLYSKRNIPAEIISDLKTTQNGFPELGLQIITDQHQIKALGSAVSTIDKIMFENKELHDSLFAHITWSKQEEQKSNEGLNLDSMEFNFAEKLLFRTLKNWTVVRFLNMFGFSNFVRFKNSKQYSSASASVIVSAKQGSLIDYMNAGRFVQRFWLKATEHNLSLHPIVGVIYCYQKVTEEKSGLFSVAHSKLLEDNYQLLHSISATPNNANSPVVFYFRMGYAKKTSYQSSRKKAEIKFTEKK